MPRLTPAPRIPHAAAALALAAWLSCGTERPVPRLVTDGGRPELIVDGEPFVVLGGEVHNSSASSLAYMEGRVWDALVRLRCNTALVPVSWELVEPEEGRFDFRVVDGLVAAARGRGLRLVLLWFGSWKNAWSTYVPAWVKTDTERFRRLETAPGVRRGALSAFCPANRDADGRAFAALMRHLRALDARHRTVILVQVENETGVLTAPRDRSPAAEAAFAGPVPEALTGCLAARGDALRPALRKSWTAAGARASGSWSSVFGPAADEVFMAWHVASYVESVAAAGWAEYPLPLFANAWLVQFEGQPAGQYPSGGPVSRMADVWECAAPHIRFLAPDIYIDGFARVCADYSRDGRPLFIPEMGNDEGAASNALFALAGAGAVGVSPFGIESMVRRQGEDGGEEARDSGSGSDPGARLADTYGLFADMMPLFLQWRGTAAVTAVLQADSLEAVRTLGPWRLHFSFEKARTAGKAPPAAMAAAVGDDTFFICGSGVSVRFSPASGGTENVDFLFVEEGRFRLGEWIPGRRLNGDEYGVRLGPRLESRKVRVYAYR